MMSDYNIQYEESQGRLILEEDVGSYHFYILYLNHIDWRTRKCTVETKFDHGIQTRDFDQLKLPPPDSPLKMEYLHRGQTVDMKGYYLGEQYGFKGFCKIVKFFPRKNKVKLECQYNGDDFVVPVSELRIQSQEPKLNDHYFFTYKNVPENLWSNLDTLVHKCDILELKKSVYAAQIDFIKEEKEIRVATFTPNTKELFMVKIEEYLRKILPRLRNTIVIKKIPEELWNLDLTSIMNESHEKFKKSIDATEITFDLSRKEVRLEMENSNFTESELEEQFNEYMIFYLSVLSNQHQLNKINSDVALGKVLEAGKLANERVANQEVENKAKEEASFQTTISLSYLLQEADEEFKAAYGVMKNHLKDFLSFKTGEIPFSFIKKISIQNNISSIKVQFINDEKAILTFIGPKDGIKSSERRIQFELYMKSKLEESKLALKNYSSLMPRGMHKLSIYDSGYFIDEFNEESEFEGKPILNI